MGRRPRGSGGRPRLHAADQRLRFTVRAVYGKRTDEIAQWLDEAAAGAEVLVVQGGINDIAQGRPVAEAAANLRG